MKSEKKVAIVIGGTGVVGRELVAQLAQAEHIGLVRSLTRRTIEYQDSKIENHVIDFENLEASRELFNGDVFFSCLGTTKKAAGSIQAQRRVDLDYQLACAELAKQQGVQHALLVSSSGANRHSPMAYPKMKGQLEHALKQLKFTRLTILQPSLLLGTREKKRVGEELAAAILPALTKLPGLRKARPIQGAQVAERMVQESLNDTAGSITLTLDEIFVD